jgi:MFS-type transporter involved in bile tolerance (Atg22 family)
MYDFANTIFAMNVISLYFALWVTVDMKGKDILYSWALSGSMLLAVLSSIVFMSVYTKKVIGFSDSEIITFYIISTIFAIAGSFVTGFITDRLGPKRTLMSVLRLWYISILLVVISMKKSVFWVVGPLVGICLGATGTSARALVVDLSPPINTIKVIKNCLH